MGGNGKHRRGARDAKQPRAVPRPRSCSAAAAAPPRPAPGRAPPQGPRYRLWRGRPVPGRRRSAGWGRATPQTPFYRHARVPFPRLRQVKGLPGAVGLPRAGQRLTAAILTASGKGDCLRGARCPALGKMRGVSGCRPQGPSWNWLSNRSPKLSVSCPAKIPLPESPYHLPNGDALCSQGGPLYHRPGMGESTGGD